MDYYYNIEIKVEPELFGNKPMYFWCITKNSNNSASNNGHGWSESIESAAVDAYTFYQRIT